VSYQPRLNESVARIESLKVRILGNASLAEAEKQEMFQELDLLRGFLLESISMQGPANKGSKDSILKPAMHFGSNLLTLEGIIGHNKKIKKLLSVISKVACSKLTILLEGETGTGKELLARIVHINSERQKIVSVNCGAFPIGLIESELFGHVKGAFTGANVDRKGKFQEADGGTIFLDEIGDLEPTAQVKILRVLEHGELQRVGSEKIYKVDVRVIAATNKHLESMVEDGLFREDLLYRINICPLNVPPLRVRRDEIEILFEHFIQDWQKSGFGVVPNLSEDLYNFIYNDYQFPGNIRELKNLAQYIACIAGEETVGISDLPDRYQQIYNETSQKKLEKNTVGDIEYVRSCLAKIHVHFARVNFSIAIRTMFSAVAVRISTSFDSLLKCPNQENVLSTIHLFGITAKPSLIRIEIYRLIFKRSSTKSTAVPRYPPSPESASIVGYFSTVLSSTSPACLVSLRFAACTETWRRFPRISTTICLLRPFTFFPPSNPTSSLASWVLTL
jgi:transcriptional regulator with AAA-type ATPase domain